MRTGHARDSHGRNKRVLLPLPADAGGEPSPSRSAPKAPEGLDSTGRRISCAIQAGTVLFLVAVAWAILVPKGGCHGAREAQRRAECAGNLREIGCACMKYAEDNPDGYWPPLSSRKCMFMFTPDSVYPKYLPDPKILVCPSNDDAEASGEIDDQSYYYLGYALTSEEEMLAFLERYPDFIAEGADFTQDLPAPPGLGSFGGDVFRRFRQNVCENTDMLPRDIPVMFDATTLKDDWQGFHHVPGGANILYLDGHIEFLRYPGKFPMTKAVVEEFTKLDK